MVNGFGEKWKEFISHNRSFFDAFFFDNYLQKCHFLEEKNKIVLISVPSRFVKRIFLEKELDKTFNNLIFPHRVTFVVDQKWTKPEKEPKENQKQHQTFSDFTFENLVIGCFNRGVVTTIENILTSKKTWNPFFIHSEPGLGKTHILKAMVSKSKQEKKKVIYLHANSFSNQVLDAFNKKESAVQKLKEEIINHQIILFDDIQLFTSRKKINEVLFQILYDAVEKERKIIFSSDQHPSELSGFEKRLRSRFAQGLVLKIDYPTLKTAELITKQKVIRYINDVSKIDPATISYIAKNFHKDIRQIEGVVRKIEFVLLEDPNREITVEEFRTIFQEQKFVFEKKISPKKIKKIVAKFYGVDYHIMLSKARKSETVKARSVAMYLIRKLTNENFINIALSFNGKNHATVVNAVKKISKLLRTSREYQDEVKRLTTICQES